MPALRPAPELDTVHWFNTRSPLTLAALRGRVVALHAFQMLCPGCVQLALPQATKLNSLFPADQVAVIGLHSVFEHHEAMTPVALEAFIHEYRLKFPIAVDRPDGRGGIPATMAAYRMQGTPTLVLIDRQGRLRVQHFGHVDDLVLGTQIGALLAEPASADVPAAAAPTGGPACTPAGCTA